MRKYLTYVTISLIGLDLDKVRMIFGCVCRLPSVFLCCSICQLNEWNAGKGVNYQSDDETNPIAWLKRLIIDCWYIMSLPVAVRTLAHFLFIAKQGLRHDMVCYLCNVFSHWPRSRLSSGTCSLGMGTHTRMSSHIPRSGQSARCSWVGRSFQSVVQ